VGAGCGRGRRTKKTKAIRCGACYYSIVLNAHRVTSMADTDIDAVRKQKKAEYDKQYRLKRKLLLQQQASKDIYMIWYFLEIETTVLRAYSHPPILLCCYIRLLSYYRL
jgi:hypothetical protein